MSDVATLEEFGVNHAISRKTAECIGVYSDYVILLVQDGCREYAVHESLDMFRGGISVGDQFDQIVEYKK